MENLFITKENLNNLSRKFIDKGYIVIGINKENNFVSLKADDDFIIGSNTPPTKISMKEFFFPKTETLFYYKQDHNNVQVIDPKPFDSKILVIGAKPCDNAAVPILSKVFNWDYKDDFFNSRVENSIIIGTACSYKDEYCFCESVGLNQQNKKGADIFLTPLKDDTYKFEIITEKGKIFTEEVKELLSSSSSDKMNASDGGRCLTSTEAFDYNNVKQWLDKNFEHQYWENAGEMCLGCGQCAFACPTCHCFDIVDEQNGSCAGRRAKNWDACQFSLFTKHASGHNPRDNREKRYRQRINHKFKYYQDKFEEILCTGCGRCSRGCPVSTDILQILQDINNLQISNSN